MCVLRPPQDHTGRQGAASSAPTGTATPIFTVAVYQTRLHGGPTAFDHEEPSAG